MLINPCGTCIFYSSTKKVAGKLLFLLCLLIGFRGYSQSYFYFETKLNSPGAPPLTYYIFLTLEGDGTATGRIRYQDPASGESRLVEQSFIDSSDAAMNESKKYLVSNGDPYYIEGTGDSGFVKPIFVFQKQVDNSGSFYIPSSVEYKGGDGNWHASEMIVNQQKTYQDLSREKEFVSYFFNEADNFYSYLFKLDTRGLSNIEQKTRLFLVAVANTNDSTIGVTSRKDLDKITEIFTTLAEQLGITIFSKKIWGTEFSKKAVDDALDKWLKPTPIDIVVFYYSGHGFRYTNDVSKYPRISLRTSKKQPLDLNNLSIENVYTRILKKQARVNIVVSDCCNEDIGAPVPIGKDILRPKSTVRTGVKLNIDNCKALFFPGHPVSILSSSAEMNQLAVGNPALGGFFTNFFHAQLVKSLFSNGGESSWLRILLNAKENTRKQALTAPCNNSRCVQRAEISVIPPQ